MTDNDELKNQIRELKSQLQLRDSAGREVTRLWLHMSAELEIARHALEQIVRNESNAYRIAREALEKIS